MALDRQIQISVRQMLAPGASIARLIEESSRLRVGSSHAAIQDVVALLMGSESIRWKPLAQSDAHKEVCEVLVCPGDGGAGIDGYRPLAQSLLEAHAVYMRRPRHLGMCPCRLRQRQSAQRMDCSARMLSTRSRGHGG